MSQTPPVHVAGGCHIEPSAILGREPRATAANRRPLVFERSIEIGAGSVVGAYAVIYWGARIGRDCQIGDHAVIREGASIGDRCVVGIGAEISHDATLEDDARVLSKAFVVGGMRIGASSVFGIGAISSNHRQPDPAAWRWDATEIASPVVGRGVMIGAGAILLAGIEIGDGAVIGSGAVVTKSVPAGARALGVPARW